MQLRALFAIACLLCITLFVGLVSSTYAKYGQYVYPKQKLVNYKDQGITLYDRNNTPFYFINNAKEDDYVPLEDISPYLQKAVVATEDKDFYHHHGISYSGIARSALLNLQSNSFAYGGSTITQQLVKNTLLSPRKSIVRKLQEALLAIDVESHYSKDQILEMYLNTIYYGEGAIGIKEAAKKYFNKDPRDLTLSESSYIAGILKYPSLLSPYTGDVSLGRKIQKQVLENMRNEDYITDVQAIQAENENLTFQSGDKQEVIVPHFALMVIDKLKEMYGNDVVYDGLKVKTSLDLNFQMFAQQILEQNVDENMKNGVTNGAVVVLDPTTGEILVLVGSRDWFDEQYGRVNMASVPRQPGSAFKPIVYSLAMDEGIITPATVLKDEPKTYVLDSKCAGILASCSYSPRDFDGSFRGPVTVRRALANSLNLPAVEVMDQVGIDTVLERAPDFGITTLKDTSFYGRGLSIVLGSAEVPPVEMADAYATFANEGKRPDPVMILEVKDKFGNVKYQYTPNLHQVISPESAYLITSILSDDKARQEEFGNLLSTPFSAAVKTGTTENFKDAWTIGYTQNYVTAVWVGNNNMRPIYNLPGSLAAAPIWKEIMAKMVKSEKASFKRPDDVVKAEFCDSSASNSARIDYFVVGSQPVDHCSQGTSGKDLESQDIGQTATPISGTPTPTPTETPTQTLTPTNSITSTPLPSNDEEHGQ